MWNQNRLALPALLVPPDELLRRGLLHPSYRLQFGAGSSMAGEPLLFLPVADIPTLKKRRRLTAPHGLPALEAARAPAAAPAAAAAALPKQLPALPVAAAAAVQAAAAAALAAGVSAQPPMQVSSGDAAAATAAAAAVAVTTAGTARDSMDVDAPSASADAQQGSGSLLQPETQDGADGGSSAAAMQSEEGDAAAAAAAAAGEDSGHQPQQQQRQDAAAEKRKVQTAPPALAEDEEDDMVEGLLLVTARTALFSRFALNGTYFQVRIGARSCWSGRMGLVGTACRAAPRFIERLLGSRWPPVLFSACSVALEHAHQF